jgi:hypothetical protein
MSDQPDKTPDDPPSAELTAEEIEQARQALLRKGGDQLQGDLDAHARSLAKALKAQEQTHQRSSRRSGGGRP